MTFIRLVGTAGKGRRCFWTASPSPGYLHAYRFTHMQQVEISPLPADCISETWMDVTSEMTLTFVASGICKSTFPTQQWTLQHSYTWSGVLASHSPFLFIFLFISWNMPENSNGLHLKTLSIFLLLCFCVKQDKRSNPLEPRDDPSVCTSDNSSFGGIQNMKDSCNCSTAVLALGLFFRGNQTVSPVNKSCDLLSPTHTCQSQQKI